LALKKDIEKIEKSNPANLLSAKIYSKIIPILTLN